MEELESYEIKPAKASLGRGESSTEGLLADHTSDDELHQVLFPSGFRADSGESVPSKGLTSD
jgi:hypothetical protein